MGFSFLKILYLIHYLPFHRKRLNYLSIMNECLVLFYSHFLVAFTDFNLNPQARYNIGWFVLSAIFLVSLINIAFIAYDIFKSVFSKSKKLVSSLKLTYKRYMTKKRLSLMSTQSSLKTLECSSTIRVGTKPELIPP